MNPIDLQINGYAGVDFNRVCSLEKIHKACELLVADNVEGVLATIITADERGMVDRIRAIVNAAEQSDLVRRMIIGIHVEGPFLSPEHGYVGAHDSQFVVPADLGFAKRLVDAGKGLVRLVTLAPEYDELFSVTQWFTDNGIVVSAGHCNPTTEQLLGAIDHGLCMFTHLGNGCPLTLHRHDNVIQRVLGLADKLWCCFIADGVHVDFAALKNYIKLVGVERSIVVTDAISAATLGPGVYTLGDWEIEIGSDLVARAPSGDHFVGSTMTMPRTIENLSKLGFSKIEIETMTSLNPRKALGLSTETTESASESA